MTARKLTVGMLTYDDYDGVYFTVQAIRLFHAEVSAEVEFLIIDNRPEGAHGAAVKRLCEWIAEPVEYVALTERKGTGMRNEVFARARTEYVLCMDPHVMLAPGALRKLIAFFESGRDEGDLLQGPLVYDGTRNVATHFEPTWRDQMWGIWATDDRGRDPEAEPFEIPAQGLGVFACRKDSWLGFNPRFRGFGGEECYVHEKFRKAGRKTLCLPFLRWMHRFERPGGIPYPLRLEDRVRNYLIGHAELGMDLAPVAEHFQKSFTPPRWNALVAEAIDTEMR